jgi:dsDNA-binding SOS-regulon protein
MKAADFDKAFEAAEKITNYLDVSQLKKPLLEQKRVNVDLPVWMITLLDKEAARLGVTRQSVIKFWLAEKLDAITTVS